VVKEVYREMKGQPISNARHLEVGCDKALNGKAEVKVINTLTGKELLHR